MLPFPVLLQHSLIYGGLLTLLMSVIIFVTLYLCPKIWIDDAPADIQAAVGPLSPRDRLLKQLAGAITILLVGGLLIHAIVRLYALGQGATSFIDVALSTFLIVQVFSLVDLVVIDWLIVVTLRPRFVVLPGTEHLQGYRDYWFHFHAFLKGMAGSLIASLVIAGISTGVAGLFG